MMTATPEGKVKAAVKVVLDQFGAYHHWPVPLGYGAPTVDCLACVNGRFIAIECKRPGGKPTPRQSVVLQRVSDAGGCSVVIDSAEAARQKLPSILARGPNAAV